MNDEKIYIRWGDDRKYLLLSQMQIIISSIYSEYPDNEYRNMCQVFISNNDSEESRKAKEQERLMEEKIRKDIE
jgi:hypothetical protein